MASEQKFDDAAVEGVIMKPMNVINKAAQSKTGKRIGGWVFMIGFLIAVIAGLIQALAAIGMLGTGMGTNDVLLGLMALIGLVVGLVNISDKEAINFLIGAIAITGAAAALGALSNLGQGVVVVGQVTSFVAVFVSTMASYVAMFIAPAAIIVALKVVYSAARKC